MNRDTKRVWQSTIEQLALRCYELEHTVKEQQFKLSHTYLNGIVEEETAERIKQLYEVNECLKTLNCDLQYSRDLLHTIFNTISDGLLLIDANGCILVANSAVAMLFGTLSDTLIGQHWDTICQCDIASHQASELPLPNLADLATIRQNHPFKQRSQLVRPDRTSCVVDIHAFPVYDSYHEDHHQHATIQIILHIIDITERLQMELLVREQERLAASRELIGKVAHVVNSPLQAILNSLILVEQASDTERAELLLLAQDEIERIGTMLHQLDQLYDEGW